MAIVREVAREMTIDEMIFLLKEKGYLVIGKKDIINLTYTRIKPKEKWDYDEKDFKTEALTQLRLQLDDYHFTTKTHKIHANASIEVEQAVLQIVKTPV